jgi:molecular chaperone HtpG
MNIKAAKDKGYEVVVLNGPLDTHFAGWVEGKFEKVKFRCVDGGPMDQLIEKEVTIESVLSEDQRKTLEDSVKAVVNELAFEVKMESLPPQDDFISVHRNEWERRMEDMAKMGNGFPYGNMGLNKQTMVVNTNHALASKVLGKDGEGRNELLQYCMDLAMLQRGQLQGESLERFVKKAQGFILD